MAISSIPSASATPRSTIVSDDCRKYASVGSSPRASVYHHPGWRDAFGVYRLACHWLVAEEHGQVVGQLPLVQQASPLFGRRLISLPWVDEAGPLGSPRAVAMLIDQAADLARRARCKLVLKLPIATGAVTIAGAWEPLSNDKVLLRRRLGATADALWTELSPKVRNQVRKGEKSGLVTTRGGAELIGDFYEVYSRNMRDLGSPPHSQRFFQTLIEALGDRAAVYCTRCDGQTVGAGIVLDNRPSLDIPWASSRRDFNRLCVNHAMYWRILADACEAGYEWFHFGRSSLGSGQYNFKMQWGAEEIPLVWLQSSHEPLRCSEATQTSDKEKFALAQKIWTQLPLWASRRLGPRIIRNVP